MTESSRQHHSGPILSRRTLFQGVGLGLTALAVTPDLARAAPPAAAKPVFSFAGAAGHDPSAVPALNGGSMVVVDTYGKGTSAGSSAYLLSAPDASVQWVYPFQELDQPTIQGGFATPLIVGSVVYLASRTQVIALDLESGAPLWTKPYQVAAVDGCPFTPQGQRIVFLDESGTVVCLSPDGSESWTQDLSAIAAPIGLGLPVGPPVATSVGMCVVWGGHLYQLDVDGEAPSAHPVPPTIVPRPVAGLDEIYYVTIPTSEDNATLVALDTSTWSPSWSIEAGTKDLSYSAPVVSSGMLYLGTSAGQFLAYALGGGLSPGSTRSAAWTAQMGTADLTQDPIVVSDGYAYVAGQTRTGANIYAVALSPSTAGSQHEAVVQNAGFTGAAIVGVDSSVCYYSKTDSSARIKIQGINLTQLFAQFLTESQLMADDYSAASAGASGSGSTPTPASPRFRTQVLCVTPNKTPRAHSSIKVWASEDVTISIRGKDHSVGPGRHTWVTTDAAGEFSIMTTPDNVSSPALYMWAPFMASREAMIVYPDQDTVSTLSSVTGSDLLAMKDFTGTPSLPSNYDASNVAGLAATVQNTLGDTKASLDALQSPASNSRSYFAFPDSTSNLVYQAVVGSSSRPYVQTSGAWYTEFDEDGTATYSEGEPPPGFADTATLGKKKHDDFDSFLRDIVHGHRTIKRIIWTAEKDAKRVAKQIHNDLGHAYNFVVDTVEKAASVVAGVLRTAMKELHKAIESLCDLFDWAHIVDVARDLKGKILDQLEGLAKHFTTDATADLKSWLQTNQNGSSTAAVAAMGSRKAATQPHYGNPQAYYGAHGAKSYCSSRWALDKTTSKGSGTVSLSSLSDSHLDQLAHDVKQAVEKIGATVSDSQAEEIPKEVKKAFHELERLVSHPSQYADLALSDLLTTILDQITAVLTTVAIEILELLIEALATLVTDLVKWLDSEIDIPVLSAVFSALNPGLTFSILDLVCLLVAIPAEIVSKAAEADSDSDELTQLSALEWGYIFSAATYLVVDFTLDLTNYDGSTTMKTLLGAWAGLSAAQIGLGAALVWAPNGPQPPSGLWVFLQFLQLAPVASAIVPAVLRPNPAPSSATGAQVVAAVVDGFYAVFGSVLAGIAFSMKVPGLDTGDDLADNLFTFVPEVFNWAPLAVPGPGNVFLAVVDGVCDAGALGATVYEWPID